MNDFAAVECFEFSTKSRIEFDRVDFTLDALDAEKAKLALKVS
jgi:hypothetical protein